MAAIVEDYRSPHDEPCTLYQRFGIPGNGWKAGWHPGCDTYVRLNANVVSVSDGKVASVNACGPAYGNHIFILNDDGIGILYAHLNSISVGRGQQVSVGQKIGTEGNTGSVGAREHLHVEVHPSGVWRLAAAGSKQSQFTDPQKRIDYTNYEGDELTMATYKELHDAIIKEVGAMMPSSPMIYNYVDANMPEYARQTIQKLMDKGYLRGNEKGELGLDDNLLRVLVMLDRAGAFGE